METDVYAVVVTYNRALLLMKCLAALRQQTRSLQRTLVLDNASTDETRNQMEQLISTVDGAELSYLRMRENLGGAGGFAEGLRRAVDAGADWIWMMDDDAEPHPSALEELMKVADDPANVFGSLATHGPDTSWTTTLLGPPQRIVDLRADVPERARVRSLPFLGFMIHRDLVRRLGMPDAGYFIAADDIEYCLRAERAGAQIVIAGKSLIEHPRSDRYVARILGRQLICLKLPPWKRYYETRNRLLIARKYYGAKLLTHAIPGSFVRLFAALVNEPRKLAQLWAFTAGFIDGMLGLKGKRHQKWHIGQ